MNDSPSGFSPPPSALSSIAIIGAGQIGSRHLQGLALNPAWRPIHLVDPSEESLGIAAERFAQVASDLAGEDVRLLRSIDQLPSELDLAIVATSSNVRRDVIRQLVDHAQVRALVLEKVLFQRLSDYDEIEGLLAGRPVSCWVNCCYRTTEFYRDLKAKVAGRGAISIRVTGPSWWGLGCNAVHFMDLLAFFSGISEMEFDEVQLDDDLLDAKRAGFKEFTGRLSCRNARGDRLVMESVPEEEMPWTLEIKADNAQWSITNPFDDVRCREDIEGDASTVEVSIPFQSQRTQQLTTHVLNSGACDLPSYADAAALHRPLIRVLLDHYRRVSGVDTDACPIT